MSAHAVLLADQGRRVLLVSTDPASNADQVVDAAIGNRLTTHSGCSQTERPGDRSAGCSPVVSRTRDDRNGGEPIGFPAVYRACMEQ